MTEPRTVTGRRHHAAWHGPYSRDPCDHLTDILAIEDEARAEALQSVLRGLRSEGDTVLLRAIIVSVEWMLENPSGPKHHD